MVHRPFWFKNNQTLVSFAETIGINKDGLDLFVVDSVSGLRTTQIDDRVGIDIDALFNEVDGPTSRWVDSSKLSVAVPNYYDNRHAAALDDLLSGPEFEAFEPRSLGDLAKDRLVVLRSGHGSPSADLRNSSVPYIKVSDIRAGQVNINPSNLVSEAVARRFWKGDQSGIEPFDLITPIRSSKNIGEFAIIMPGQERIVLTKEVLVVRATRIAPIDNFYLMWALSLKVVRDQWRRIVFMQTNREDVGTRFQEIRIPWPNEGGKGELISREFRDYYVGIEALRTKFVRALERGRRHHVFLNAPLEALSEDEADDD